MWIGLGGRLDPLTVLGKWVGRGGTGQGGAGRDRAGQVGGHRDTKYSCSGELEPARAGLILESATPVRVWATC